MRGVNDDEVVDFATFGREPRRDVRFIEFMPLDASGEWSADKVVSRDEIVAAIDAVYPLEPRRTTTTGPSRPRSSATATARATSA